MVDWKGLDKRNKIDIKACIDLIAGPDPIEYGALIKEVSTRGASEKTIQNVVRELRLFGAITVVGLGAMARRRVEMTPLGLAWLAGETITEQPWEDKVSVRGAPCVGCRRPSTTVTDDGPMCDTCLSFDNESELQPCASCFRHLNAEMFELCEDCKASEEAQKKKRGGGVSDFGPVEL